MILPAPYKPKECEVRIKRMFAFWPIPLPDGRRIWLQWYWIKQRFQSKAYADDTSWQAELMKLEYSTYPKFMDEEYRPSWLAFGPYLTRESIPASRFDNNPLGN